MTWLMPSVTVKLVMRRAVAPLGSAGPRGIVSAAGGWTKKDFLRSGPVSMTLPFAASFAMRGTCDHWSPGASLQARKREVASVLQTLVGNHARLAGAVVSPHVWGPHGGKWRRVRRGRPQFMSPWSTQTHTNQAGCFTYSTLAASPVSEAGSATAWRKRGKAWPLAGNSVPAWLRGRLAAAGSRKAAAVRAPSTKTI